MFTTTNISVFTNLFLSPIADLAPTFYMYFIEDTVIVDSQRLVRLSFRPRNPNDLLFRGTMWITLDGNYAIQQLRLLVSKSINFNFVREMRIDQDFTRQRDGRYLLTKSDVLGDFGITKNGVGLFGERTVSFLNFATNKPIPTVCSKDRQRKRRIVPGAGRTVSGWPTGPIRCRPSKTRSMRMQTVCNT